MKVVDGLFPHLEIRHSERRHFEALLKLKIAAKMVLNNLNNVNKINLVSLCKKIKQN